MALLTAGLLVLLSFLAFAGAAQAAPTTTVSFTFDDGRPSQLAAATELNSHGMKATFFIISGAIGNTGVMTVADLNTLKSQGMEIGAHTVLHRDLPTLPADEAMREACISRNWLMDRGFDVYDLAYPHDTTNAAVEQIVANCGFNSARAGSQLQCDSGHACAETVPPLDPYALRTPNDFESSTTLAQMKAAVTNAENNGGGWVPLEIHDVCDLGETLPDGETCFAPYMVTHSIFTQFVTWVQGEVDAGRVQVKTVHDVIGGALQPEVPVAPAPVRTGNMLVNPSFEQAGANGAPSSCWANINNGPDHPPTITTTSDAHAGTTALAINVPATYDSWAYNLIAPTLDLAQCSPVAIPGHHYTFSGWYKGNGPLKLVAYWRNADNQWQRLDWGSAGTQSFPASASWTQASFTFVAPVGATGVSAGFYVDTASANHSYTIDDQSLIDADAPLSYPLTAALAGTGTGSVTSSPAGITCGSTCQASFATGSTVTLTAAAAAGSSFTGWSGACTGSAGTCAVSINAAKSATATFTLLPVQLTVATAGTGGGSVTSSPAGIDCGATCQFSFVNGTSVTLTAAAAAGSSFTGWSGACTGSAGTCTVSLNAAKTVGAAFTLLPVQLSVATAGTGAGSVTSSPAGINCGATCQFSFVNGASVTLTAAASAGSSFTGWSGACAGSATTCTVSLNAAKSVTATFTLLPMQLTVATTGTGGGTITSSPTGINCGSTCQFSFVNGTTVTLTAVAAAGSSFAGWSGVCAGAGTTCTVTMDVARSVMATFTLLPVQLNVSTTGTGGGTVTSSPAGINCGVNCQFSYVNGTSVTLTAVAAAGSSFTGWTGACSGSATTCTVSLTAAKSVTAIFTLLPVQLTVTTTGTGGGTVTSSPAGINCGVNCQFSFVNGATVTLTAVTAAGSSFTGWSGACSGSATTCTVSLDAAKSVTAVFTLLPVQLSVTNAGTGNGSVTSSPAGIDCGSTCQFSFVNGSSVTLTAVAAPGSSFTGWTGACTGSATTCTVLLSLAKSVTATFTLLPVQLSVGKSGTGAGSVTSSPAGINCGATCQFSFANGATVTLTAAATPGSSFTGWSGACSGSATTCTVSLDAAKSVTAVFTLLPVQLSVGKSGTGAGSVTSSPAGIDCGATCQFSFVNGATVTLTAVAASGSSFTGWTGACTGSSSTCTVSLDAAKSVTAVFTLLPVQLSVSNAGTGNGSVTSSPAGINCGTTCQFSFVNGATVTLTAVAAPGSTFTGWTGACSGSSATCVVSLTAAKSVTATFSLPPVQLTVGKTGTGGGTVTSSPAGINCGATCQFSFVNGATVTLTAVAASGSSFAGWTGACSGSGTTCTVSLDAAKSVTAVFTLLPVQLSLSKSGTGNGSVTSSPAGIDCGATCQFSFVNGATVTLTAVAAPGSSFTGWTGACSGSGSTCTVSLSVARSVTATFTLLPMQLTVSIAGTGDGSVVSSPVGIDCGVTCQLSFVNGAMVTLTAVAAPGSSFTGWTGACSGSAATCTVSMNAAKSVTATFTLLPVQLTVATAGTGAGTVTSNPLGIDCGTTCLASLDNGTTVTLTAVAAAGSTFTGWSDPNCAASTTCTVSLTEARTLTAFFTITPVVPPASVELVTTIPVPVPVTPVAPVTPVVKATVKTRPTLRTRPKVTGRNRVGRTLTCTRGTWNGSPTRYVLTWRRDGKVVLGHAARYVIRKADAGHTITCSVAASNAKGASTSTSLALHVPR